jgi:hypothetical protein
MISLRVSSAGAAASTASDRDACMALAAQMPAMATRNFMDCVISRFESVERSPCFDFRIWYPLVFIDPPKSRDCSNAFATAAFGGAISGPRRDNTFGLLRRLLDSCAIHPTKSKHFINLKYESQLGRVCGGCWIFPTRDDPLTVILTLDSALV